MNTPNKKIVIYQVITRLFGNKNTNNIPWGTIKENGVGKFSDFTEKALIEIKNLGVTHIWYTGVLHHALLTDYTLYGITLDDPNVVKGRAGSPYAVKDYYNVNPDLANNPAKRLDEFIELIERTHKVGLKLIIDIVPNHVARKYKGLTNPDDVSDFGACDDTSVEYRRDNNFYYIPGEHFVVPESKNGYKPLDGELHPLSDQSFYEFPAKWTGNGSRKAQPDFYDWYETVKINFGVKPDGTYDFDCIPDSYYLKDYLEHYKFWETKDIPDSWKKFRDIALYWLQLGVDGFRYDMAELVPVDFWSYLNSSIKMAKKDALLLAEVYQPHLYRDYLKKGKMDYLYDKVELYDTLKNIIRHNGSTDKISDIQNGLTDIEHHMLHFLENHDEQRIASPEFAGDPIKGKPMLTLSTTISTSPTMIYFGQENGEPARENAGFGSASRTSIYDYIGVPTHQRWMNNGSFDGGQSTLEEKDLHDFYKKVLNFSINSCALASNYCEIHRFNRAFTEWYNDHVYSFIRWCKTEKLLIACNFSSFDSFGFNLQIPKEVTSQMNLSDGSYKLTDCIYNQYTTMLNVQNKLGIVRIDLAPLESFILNINAKSI